MDKCTHGFIVGSCKACALPLGSGRFEVSEASFARGIKATFHAPKEDPQATRIRDLETALNHAGDHADAQEARINALEAEAHDALSLVYTERDALQLELNASSAEMARACVQIDDLRAERKELRELCRIGGNALSTIKRGVADAYHEHRCGYEPCVVCELHALVEECTKIPDGK